MQSRNKSAQSLLEVVFAIAFLIPTFIVFGDLYLLLVGSRENEDLCRNAARAAATGAPAEATQRVATIIGSSNRVPSPLLPRFRLATPVDVQVSSQNQDELDGETANTDSIRQVHGTVKVATEVEVQPFLLHLFVGRNGPIKFRAEQVCPISYMPRISQVESTR